MSVRADPITGNMGGYPSDLPTLTPEQLRFADSRQGWCIASQIHSFTNSPEGGRWFSKWKLGEAGAISESIGIGQSLGLWDKDQAKAFWRHNRVTWPWVLTALALRDEWGKRDTKGMTQADYDAHNWWAHKQSTNNAPSERKE